MKILKPRLIFWRSQDIINIFSMPKIFVVSIIGMLIVVLLCSIPAAAVQMPLPGQGNQTLILYGVHPNAKDNKIITSFLAEHGELRWHEAGYNSTHEYVYITPVNACTEQLVYLNKIRADERNNEPSIEFVKIIGCGESLPPEPVDPFSEIYSKYPALKNDENLQFFIKTYLPDRYEKSISLSSKSEVYFINDTGTFTEYIVSLKSGVIISSEYISEDFLSVNKSTAIKQALLDKSSDTGVNSIKVIISEGIPVWEISTIEGSKMGVNYITTEILADRIPLKANPTEASCACAAVAIPGIAVSYIIFRRNQKEMETKL